MMHIGFSKTIFIFGMINDFGLIVIIFGFFGLWKTWFPFGAIFHAEQARAVLTLAVLDASILALCRFTDFVASGHKQNKQIITNILLIKGGHTVQRYYNSAVLNNRIYRLSER